MMVRLRHEARGATGVAFVTAFLGCHARMLLLRSFHTWIRCAAPEGARAPLCAHV